jgi:hypothetical protein
MVNRSDSRQRIMGEDTLLNLSARLKSLESPRDFRTQRATQRKRNPALELESKSRLGRDNDIVTGGNVVMRG